MQKPQREKPHDCQIPAIDCTSKDKHGGSANLPDNAKVTWYYYGIEQLQQAQEDCESTGGNWINQ
ncbi:MULTISPECIES: hypothetical protein [Pseudomonas]|uniref:Uncharacterized protein n=1 Tax=Pseudomonas bijieensis TaxID=2681983 RepID=A0A6N1C5I5_9PSED|nr:MULTISPECIES: hypothetical protein [Pseudomonas]AXP03480.1 hypothetical protein DZG01_10995 [Pseudomonas fluorescens]PWJ35256.1 hypothetical protein ATJ40_107208 [Pseudomonas sp. 43mfcvi1.1]QIB03118.1 hypothetical protein GZ982_28200 [Pseudomonas fluorescens]QKS80419.1 hypothetical protein GN234_02305 [Pseudomonas bijieensis]SSB97304.1 hypothetical protein SAMN04488697_107208 [Pseudomonas sp. 43mfcvi1.1]